MKKIFSIRCCSLVLCLVCFSDVVVFSQNQFVKTSKEESIHFSLFTFWEFTGVLMCVIVVALLGLIIFMILKNRKLKTHNNNVFTAMNAENIVVWSYDINKKMLYNVVGQFFIRDSVSLYEGLDMIHIDDIDLFKTRIKRLLYGEIENDVLTIRLKKNVSNEYVYFRNKITVQRDNTGKVVSLLGICSDATIDQLVELKNKSIHKCLDMTTKSSEISTWVYNYITKEIELIYGFENIMDLRVSRAGYEEFWYIHPLDKAKYKELISSVVSGKSNEVTAIIRMMRSGKYCYCDTIISAVRDNKNRCLYLVGYHKDLSSINSLSEKIKEVSLESQVTLDALPVGVAIYDGLGVQQYINQSIADIFGIKNIEQHIAKGVNIYSDPDFPSIIKDTIINEEDLDVEIEYNSKSTQDGEDENGETQNKYLNVRSRFVRNKDNEIVSTILIFDDVTSQFQSRQIAEKISGQLRLAMNAGQISGWIYNTKAKKFKMIDGEESSVYLSCDELITTISLVDYDEFMELINNATVCEKVEDSIVLESITGDTITYIKIQVMRQDKYNVIGTFRDITKDVLHKKEIEDAKDMLDLALEAGNVGVWTYNVSENKFYSLRGEDIGDNGINLDSYRRLIYEEDAKMLQETINLIIDGKIDKTNTVLRYKAKDVTGGFRYIRLHMTAKKENHKVVYITGTRKDITEEYFYQTELREAKLKSDETNLLLSTILDRMPCALFIKDVDHDYRYIVANGQFCNSAAKKEEDVIGRTDYEIFVNNEAEMFRKDDLEIIENNYTKMIEEGVRWNGKDVIWHTCKSPVITSDGRKLLLGMSVDITEKNKMLREFQIAKDKAEQSDKLKSAFLANMSHEIRTPLNAIVGFSEILKITDNEDEKDEYFKIIDANNDLLLTLINDILDLSKIEAGYMELSYTKFDLVEQIEDLSTTYKNRMLNGVEFITENPYSKCIIEFDKNRLTQVITNFINNAIKFTTNGSITVGYKFENDGMRIYCTDTGIGISEENQVKVFGRFEKLNNFAQGTGLGLSICKAIAKTGGGDVGLVSKVGVGSTFWIWLPCKIEDTVTVDDFSNSQLNSVNNSINQLNDKFELKSLDILVAEDNDSNYLLIRSILKDNKLTRVLNGAEAVKMANKHKFNIVLMDIKMPIMNGLDATKLIREFDKDVKIIAVTANVFDTDKNKALNAGCNSFVSKPLNKVKLLEALNH